MKNRILVFALVLFAALAVGLEFVCRYHFFFMEQGQMFLFSGEYFADVVSVPAGLTVWMTRFFVQFFAIPWAGSIITALLLTGVGTLTALVCRRMAPGSAPLYLLWALPVVSLLLMHLNFYYHFEGTVAFLFMLTALWIYVGLKRPGRRLAAGLISTPLLYWFCGPVALPYALCVVIWEAANKNPRWYLSLLIALEVALVGQAVQWLSFIGDWWMAFTPRLYYEEMLVPTPVIMYAWIALPLVLIVARFCRGLKAASLRRETILSAVQVMLVVFVAWVGVARYFDRASYKMEQLSHLSRTGQWDAIIELFEGPVNNYLHMNYLNLALAQKGLLADDLFKYDQRGPDGLILGWDHMLHRAVILSDINYCIGNVAIAQQIAHEGYVGAAGLGNPRLLQRLVQTNLIFGAWPIAEKYLDILDKTLMYRSWAARHRRFLGDDGAVEAYYREDSGTGRRE